ncbi:MAG: response regulator transcription factor [Chloroflexi bacterium]|nr:response regulator transcription factor [Chloroflexota bacterium]
MEREAPPISDGDSSVVLAHPNMLTREAISRILGDAGFQLMGQTDDLRTLHGLVVRHHPKVIVVHRETLGFEPNAVSDLVDKAPGSFVVVLVRPQSPGLVTPALRQGARGYLSVNLCPEDFVHSLRMIQKGSVVVSPGMADSLRAELTSLRQPKPKDDLSCREREVLHLLSEGATNREIAQDLIISEHTVKVHLRGILNKLNLRNRQQAAAYAVREQLSEPPSFEEMSRVAT